jgi:uncharacterized protein (DUF58 family)
MTGRGWWCLLCVLLTLFVGVLRGVPALTLAGLALLLWFGWEWLRFAVRVRTLRQALRVERQVYDERGPVTTLWAGRTFTVRVRLHLLGGRLPHATVTDPVPFGVVFAGRGSATADGELRGRAPLGLDYDVFCPLAGAARFEGLRVETSDLQGFFARVLFVRDPVVLPVLPAVLVGKGGGPTLKRHNELPPPGIHRLRQPGSGAELLDLRDYLPGDPPRTIAWKVSARRDRLITKEFESEAPVRCTLFLDVSSSVRVPSPFAGDPDEVKPVGPAYFKPLDRLIDLAAGVVRAGHSVRDLTGLCLFDEHGSRTVRPERTANHQGRLLRLLAEAACLAPSSARADPVALLEVGYALAAEIYPDLLRPEVNAMPTWLTWLTAVPRHTRHRRGLRDALYRHKGSLFWWCTSLGPLALLALNAVALLLGWVPDWARGVLAGLLVFGTPLLVTAGWVLLVLGVVVSGPQRRQARWRKRLAALFALRYGLGPGGVEALVQDDDAFSLYLQQFLADHQVPCPTPLYDEQGRYLFANPEKVGVLAGALVAAAARGRDNELYVLMADLLELDDHLEPLLQALRVVRGRHHQVLVVCPWPGGVPLPRDTEAPGKGRPAGLRGLLTDVGVRQAHAAYARTRRALARLGVPVVCAASDESAGLIQQRLEQVRGLGGRRA